MRLRDQGYRAWLSCEAAVDHYIDGARWTWRWLLRRAYIEGRTEVALARLSGLPVSGRFFLGLAAAAVAGIKLVVRALQVRPDLVFVQLCNVASGIGSCYGVLRREACDATAR